MLSLYHYRRNEPMKIAVLTDIHANYRALETVVEHVDRWGPDQVLGSFGLLPLSSLAGASLATVGGKPFN